MSENMVYSECLGDMVASRIVLYNSVAPLFPVSPRQRDGFGLAEFLIKGDAMSIGEKVNKWKLAETRYKVLREQHIQDLSGAVGIYAIINKVNGHIYVGQSKDLLHRKRDHFRALERNCHFNPHLQSAFNFYGKQSFEFYVIELAKICELNEKEQHWIDKMDAEYNIIRDIGEFWSVVNGGHYDGCVRYHDESFSRPKWHAWVYGGLKRR